MSRNKTARQHSFAIIPDSTKPRSKFRMRQTRKMGFNASELIPIMCEEVLPGDTWTHREALFARLATPIAPLVDDLDVETWYFYVPNRILWDDWEDFITGQDTGLVVPTINPYDPDAATYTIKPGGAFDHFGLLPQDYGSQSVFTVNVLPIWAYFRIWNEWFRDQNLQQEWVWPDNWTHDLSNSINQATVGWRQQCLRVNKRSDYFTRSLPWPQKGAAVALPLTGNAPVVTRATDVVTGAQAPLAFREASAGAIPSSLQLFGGYTQGGTIPAQLSTAGADSDIATGERLYPSNLEADLSAVTAATINALRLAAITQQLLELDARGGSRYIENLLAHWSVRASNRSLQRPEYLGGSRVPITINPIAQTAAYDAQPDPESPSPVGNLGAEMHASGNKRTFTYAAEEHGYIIGLCAVRATPTYQQGTRRHWTRSVRLDFWDPLFASLGEQAVNTTEIYQPANNAPVNAIWGYQERGAEYRYTPNEITGPLRSTATLPLDWWHLAEEFANEPALNAAFITDKTQEILNRCLAIDITESEQWSCQIIMDIQHDSTVARMMPAYSVPGIKSF